jgi:xylose isomerase
MVPQRSGSERAGDERAAALPRNHKTLALEIAVRLGDGVRVDREIRDDLAHGRQLVADVERAEPQRVLHLADDLQVGRDSRLRVEMKLDHEGIVSRGFAGEKEANHLFPTTTGKDRVGPVKTSLGIWAFGGMATRFNPGGYKPELAGTSTVERVRTAVDGLGELIDDYEFHYPQELSTENIEAVRDALDGHGIYCIASGLHLDARFAKGGFCSPDDATRVEALALTREAIDLAAEVDAQMIIWPGIEGYNYPFQTPYAESWARFVDGVAEAAAYAGDRGVTVFLEHKNSEPAMKILMRNVGMTLHVIHTLRARGVSNVKVNMDWQHLIMNGENLAEYAALLAAEGLLGHQHANSGWGTFDDDNMVGATAFMETLELALELRRARYGENGERLGFDLYPYTEDAVGAVERSVLQWRFIDGIAAKIDEAELRQAQQDKDAVRAYELVYAALGA